MIGGRLHDWLQVLGSLGVFGGLIFVGLQLRQDREVAISNAVQASAGDEVEWAQLITDNSEVWAKGLAGEPLSDEEALEFRTLAAAWDIRLYAGWTRAIQGTSTSSIDRFAREAALALHTYPGLREFWHEREAYFNEINPQSTSEFIPRVNEELARFDKERPSH